MVYVSLFRKYRPQTFDDVVGQEHVTTTLQNAIRAGHVANGYLFCGTRGTAKTTCARVLAKALNCLGPNGDLTSPTPRPCGVCEPCVEIAASNFVDVLEMDAASHGKVDDVRDLVSSIKYPPMRGRYKVYIIDEAHQLSRDAMDAFLKTLEEPPDRVVFVLATTEREKLPVTIASRCQVFEFRRGSVAQIGSRLNAVLQAEQVAMEASAVTLVARAAEGSYRDSLSLLEQVLAFKRQHIRAADVTLVLGTIGDDVLSKVISLVEQSDAAGAFAVADEILGSGKDVRQFLKSLSARVRDMLFLSVGAVPTDSESIDDSAALRQQASRFSPSALMEALTVLTEAERETRHSNQHRLILEMSLLRLMNLPTAANAVSPIPSASVSLDAPKVEEGLRIVSYVEPPSSSPPPLSIAEPIAPMIESLDLNEEDEESEGLEIVDTGDAEAITDSPPLSPGLMLTLTNGSEEDLLQVQQVQAPSLTTAMSASPVSAIGADDPPELLRLRKAWPEVINRMGSRAQAGVPVIRDATPIAVQGQTILLSFTQSFYFDGVNNNEKRRKVIEEIINKTLDASPEYYRVKCVMRGTEPSAGGTSVSRAAEPVNDEHSQLMDEVIAVFGGRVLQDNDLKGDRK